MININTVRIKGFQSHINNEFNLGPNLSVITGPTDSGKTAIIRAIRWVIFNEPTGDSFVNKNMDEASVELALNTGITITKVRKKAKTQYFLSTYVDPFNQAEVPLEVKEALGISKQKFGDFETSLNFAYQLEAPFLLSEPPSVGAKVLGKLAGTEVVDLAIKSVAKDTYAVRQDKLQAEKDIERLNTALLSYQDVDDQKLSIEACEKLIDAIDAACIRVQTLKKLDSSLNDSMQVIGETAQKLSTLYIVPGLLKHVEYIEAYNLRSGNLTALYANYVCLKDTITKLDEKLSTLSAVDTIADVLPGIEQDKQRLDIMETLRGQLDNNTAVLGALNTQLALYEDISDLSTAVDNLSVNNDRYTRINSLYGNYNRYTNEINATDLILKATEDIAKHKDILQEIGDKNYRKDNLTKLHENLYSIDWQIYNFKEKLSACEGVEQAETILQGIENKRGQLEVLQKFKSSYDLKHRATLEAYENEITANDEYISAQDELELLWKQVNLCPLCERPYKFERGIN